MDGTTATEGSYTVADPTKNSDGGTILKILINAILNQIVSSPGNGEFGGIGCGFYATSRTTRQRSLKAYQIFSGKLSNNLNPEEGKTKYILSEIEWGTNEFWIVVLYTSGDGSIAGADRFQNLVPPFLLDLLRRASPC